MATTQPGNTYTASDFYNSELDRLNKKQKNSDLIENSNERLAVLNNSYRKRYAKYVEMLMVLVLVYIVYLGIVILQKNVPSISMFVVDTVTVVLIFVVFFYLFSAFWELSSRSVLNYDELDFSQYDASGVDVSALKDKGQLFASQGNTGATSVCVGNECCPISYTYDADMNICVPSMTGNSFVPSDLGSSGTGDYGMDTSNLPTNTELPTGMGSSADLSTGMGPPSGMPPPSGMQPSTDLTNIADSNNLIKSNPFGFTTLEYSKIEHAYTDLAFNSPKLKRSPNYQNVIPLKDATKLNVSSFR